MVNEQLCGYLLSKFLSNVRNIFSWNPYPAKKFADLIETRVTILGPFALPSIISNAFTGSET